VASIEGRAGAADKGFVVVENEVEELAKWRPVQSRSSLESPGASEARARR